MGNFLKQPQQRTKKREPKKTKDTPVQVVVTGPDNVRSPSIQHDINHVAGLADVEESLDWIARGVSRLTSDEHAVTLSVGQGSLTDPIQLTLASNDYDDTLDRLVAAVERIADSLAKLAGLSRPRLERWHEQEEYTPQYRDIAC